MFLLSWDIGKAQKYINRLFADTFPVAISPHEREAIEWALHQAEVLEKFKNGLTESRGDASSHKALLLWISDLENPKPKGKWEKLQEFCCEQYRINGNVPFERLMDQIELLKREHPE